jgi:hypothetical protein
LAAAFGIWLAFGFLSIKGVSSEAISTTGLIDTCYKAPKHGLVKTNHLILVGEQVPVRIASIRRRVERELSIMLAHPAQAQEIANRAKPFFRIIDPIFKQAGIPRDFRYVLAVESAFDNRVVSPRGAKGIWQLMPVPARTCGLLINNEVDERLHLEKATKAVAKHLYLLHRETGSWTGALAAYNCGLARYQRHSKRRGPNFYGQTHGPETSRFVFKVLAIKELMERSEVYGLALHRKHIASADFKTVYVNKPIANLASFAALHGTDLPTLRSLNPWLVGKSLFISESVVKLFLPKQKSQEWANMREVAADTSKSKGLALSPDSTLLSLLN